MPLHLSRNVHENIENPFPDKTHLICGNYEYYHYLCDGFDDRGWGCGYRTLQTICSWMNFNYKQLEVPSLPRIQEILVQMEDKSKDFHGSRQWIGSFEVCLVIDKLYDVPCKILHVNKGEELTTLVDTLKTHFDRFGSPVMMGGDIDASSKGVLGVSGQGNQAQLLILDPHYVGKVPTPEYLHSKGWVKWRPLNGFLQSSFYNLCLPQVKAKSKERDYLYFEFLF